MGFSPVRRLGWWRSMASRVETSIKLEKELLAQSQSCKEAAQTSGHALSVTGSGGMKAHHQRWRSSAGCAVETEALAQWWWILRKRSTSEWGLDLPKESANGWVARRLAGVEWAAVLTSARGKKMVKGKIFPAIAPSYRRRRERVWVGPLGQRWHRVGIGGK
jgi:hypothetical protein